MRGSLHIPIPCRCGAALRWLTMAAAGKWEELERREAQQVGSRCSSGGWPRSIHCTGRAEGACREGGKKRGERQCKWRATDMVRASEWWWLHATRYPLSTRSRACATLVEERSGAQPLHAPPAPTTTQEHTVRAPSVHCISPLLQHEADSCQSLPATDLSRGVELSDPRRWTSPPRGQRPTMRTLSLFPACRGSSPRAVPGVWKGV